jgi:hypothetical protein
VPLALSLLAAVVVWRVGLRLGDSVSGHGPDADAIADGVRDWTVASATGVFVLGYAAVAVLTHHLAATPATSPSLARTLLWVVVLGVVVGGGAVAVGSGRAAIWSSFLPLSLRAAAVAARRIVAWYAVAAAVVLGVSLVLNWNDAVNVMAQLHTSPGAAVLLVGVCVLLTPNATIFSGSYLLGPGFAVGAHTMVTPTAVVLGPLPMFPLLAALPGTGPTARGGGRRSSHDASLPDRPLGRRRAARGRGGAPGGGGLRGPGRAVRRRRGAGPDGRCRPLRLPGAAPRRRDVRHRRARRLAPRHRPTAPFSHHIDPHPLTPP